MEEIARAAVQPRSTYTYQAGVIQIGDHNHAREVEARFGADQTVLLAQLATALSSIAQREDAAPEVRSEAERAAAALRTEPASRIPVILERVRGIASVAGSAFDAARPILDAIRL